jgi:hypothetical protein
MLSSPYFNFLQFCHNLIKIYNCVQNFVPTECFFYVWCILYYFKNCLYNVLNIFGKSLAIMQLILEITLRTLG